MAILYGVACVQVHGVLSAYKAVLMCCEHVYEVLSAKVLQKSTLPSHEFEMLFVCVPIYIYI